MYRCGSEGVSANGVSHVYIPKSIPRLSDSLIYKNPPPSFREIASEVLWALLKDSVDASDIYSIVAAAFPFQVPVFPIDPKTYLLDLTYGPTGTVSDFGTRLALALASSADEDYEKPIQVLLYWADVRTIALARAFAADTRVQCFVVCPQTVAAEIQKTVFFTASDRLHLIAVDGTPDDCFSLVQHAQNDTDIFRNCRLITAHDIDRACLIAASVCSMYSVLSVLSRSCYDNAIDNPYILIGIPEHCRNGVSAAVLAQKMGIPLSGIFAVSGCTCCTGVQKDTSFFPADVLYRLTQLHGGDPVGSDTLFCRLHERDVFAAIEHCHERTGVLMSTDSAQIWHIWGKIRGGYVNTLKQMQQENEKETGLFRSIPNWGYADDYAAHCIAIIPELTHPALQASAIQAAIGREPPIPHRFEDFIHELPLVNIPPSYNALKAVLRSC